MLCFVSSHAVVICNLHDVLRIVCATPGSIYYRRRLAHAATLRHQSTKKFAKFPITFHFIWIANRAGDAYICIVIGNCTVRSCCDDMLVGTKPA